MSTQLISLSADQLAYLIEQGVSKYQGEEYKCIVKDISSPNAGSREDKLTFKVEISDKVVPAIKK
jgi:hypothetical protein